MKHLILITSVFFAWISSAEIAPRVHILFLIDTKAGQVGDNIGPACSNNAAALRALFEQALRPDQLKIRTVTGDDMNPEHVEWQITGFRQEASPMKLFLFTTAATASFEMATSTFLPWQEAKSRARRLSTK